MKKKSKQIRGWVIKPFSAYVHLEGDERFFATLFTVIGLWLVVGIPLVAVFG